MAAEIHNVLKGLVQSLANKITKINSGSELVNEIIQMYSEGYCDKAITLYVKKVDAILHHDFESARKYADDIKELVPKDEPDEITADDIEPVVPDGWEHVVGNAIIEGDQCWNGKKYAECIPPGWALVGPEESVCEEGYGYIYEDGKWGFSTGLHGVGEDFGFPIIRQIIDIDLSKIAIEFKSASMESDGKWYAYADVNVSIDEYLKMWTGRGDCRELMASEKPKEWRGKWDVSLLVRPEHWNGAES